MADETQIDDKEASDLCVAWLPHPIIRSACGHSIRVPAPGATSPLSIPSSTAIAGTMMVSTS